MRAAEVAGLLAWHSLRCGGRLLAARRPFRGRSAATPSARLIGRTLVELCEGLGAAFVKIGQVASARPDLLSADLVRELRRLQDEVAPIPAHRIPALLQNAFERDPSEIFADFDLRPVGSASLAQVHRATLREPVDGVREVAVKLLRPKVEWQIRSDLRLLGLMVRAIDWLPPLRPLPLREAVAEVGAAVEQQLDLEGEARSNGRFRANLEHQAVCLPKVIAPWSNRRALTMEYLPDLERLDRSSLDRSALEEATLTGLRTLFRMIFIDGFVHADLHPGNVFFRHRGEVVLVDTGLVALLPDPDRREFKTFFSGMVANDGRRCAAVVERMAVFKGPAFDSQRFTQAMVALIAHHSRLVTDDFEVAAFVAQLFELQRRHDLRGSTAFTMTILSLAVYEGIVKQTHPTLDFQRQAMAFLVRHRLNRDP
ncbi:MAG: AarF/UbiB family protein [Acidobacteriota bacterium]